MILNKGLNMIWFKFYKGHYGGELIRKVRIATVGLVR